MSIKSNLRNLNNGFAGSHLHHCRLFSLLAVVTLLFILAPAVASGANTYYLDAVNGDDSYPGTSEQPWKTLNKAQTTVAEGDTVLLQTGDYADFWDTTTIRTNWITYKANTGQTPTFTYIYLGSASGGPYNKYLHFEGIRITGLDAGERAAILVTAYYVKFINCTFVGDGYEKQDNSFGVFTKNSDNVWIDGCTFTEAVAGPEGGYWKAVGSEDSDNVEVTNCDISGSGIGILAIGADWTISNNHLHHLDADGIILASPISNVLVEDNHIHDINAPVYFTYEGEATYDDTNGIITAEGAFAGEDFVGYLQLTRTGGILVPVSLDSTWDWPLISDNDANTITITTPIGEGNYDDITQIVIVRDTHCDGIQAQMTATGEGMIVRRNHIHDIPQGIHWYPTGPDNVGANNVTIENTLIYNISHTDFAIYNTTNLKFNNNTIAGDQNDVWQASGLWAGIVLIGSNCTVNEFANNIMDELSIWQWNTVTEDFYADAATVVYEDNNIIQKKWVAIDPNFDWGESTVEIDNLTNFKALFTDYDGKDFTLAEGSMAIDFGNSTYAPISDILGVSRSIPPDAGCYEYTSSDDGGSGGSSNAAPVLDSIGNKTVSENASLTFDVNASDTDGDTITYSATSMPSGAALSGSSFSWTPSYTQSGTYQVTFAASDGTAQDSETITITINNVNRDPVLSAMSDTWVNENQILDLALVATDADGDTITYSSPDLPSGAVLSGSSFTWTPGYTQAGSYTVTFAASDGTAQDSEQVSITVNNVNRAVVLDEIGGKSAYADDSLDFTVSATDPDGDTINYSATGMPTGATFTSRVFSWTPADNQAGSYNVLFSASDGLLTDSETVTIVVTADGSAPAVTTRSPQADAVQVVLNSLVSLHIVDSGTGVNPASVTINLNGNTIYTGDTAKYISAYGNCYRVGTGSDYKYIYQQTNMFDFDQTVSITVNATDLASNQMSQHAYSFTTEMRSFGDNEQLSAAASSETQGYSDSATDNSGNIWTVWHRGITGGRNIYVGKLPAGTEQFESPIQLTNSSADQCNAAIAVDADDKLYVVWQDNRDGNWDIYSSTSTDGINWSAQRRVCDPNANQINPVIVLDSSTPANAYVAWQDDVSGNQDIFLAVSNNAFLTKTITQITSNSSGQTEPAITADTGNTVYVAWTDTRNGTSDIYAADSDNGPWTNIAVVTKSGDQTSPKIAAEQTGSILHLLWTDNISTNQDIYYGSSNGLPQSALTGSLITDDSSGADQSQPAIVVVESTGNDLKVYACWKDLRNLQVSGDSDIYFVRTDSGSGTNVFVDDDSTGSNQSNPVIAINSSNQPYIVWTDDRSSRTDIYYAGATYLNSTPINSGTITTASGGTVGPTLDNIDSADDISVTVPAGAYPSDIIVSILNIINTPASASSLSTGYEIGPSGTDFSSPVTVVIPYESTGSGTALAYWLNPETGVLSQDGISNIQKLTLSSELSAISFQTTHFSQFFVGEGGIVGVTGGGGGGGGGCSLSHGYSQAGILDFILPYAVLAVVMILLRKRDIRRQKARNI